MATSETLIITFTCNFKFLSVLLPGTFLLHLLYFTILFKSLITCHDPPFWYRTGFYLIKQLGYFRKLLQRTTILPEKKQFPVRNYVWNKRCWFNMNKWCYIGFQVAIQSQTAYYSTVFWKRFSSFESIFNV